MYHFYMLLIQGMDFSMKFSRIVQKKKIKLYQMLPHIHLAPRAIQQNPFMILCVWTFILFRIYSRSSWRIDHYLILEFS